MQKYEDTRVAVINDPVYYWEDVEVVVVSKWRIKYAKAEIVL